MRILCPHCHAEESRCPEALPACRARGAEHRRLYATANGNELEMLRAENERLRAELDALRARPTRRPRLAPLTDEERAMPADEPARAEARRILTRHRRPGPV